MKCLPLIGRILFAAIFIMSAPNHFNPETIKYADDHGVPWASVSVPLAGLVALAGGLSILLGFRGRFGALLLVLFLVPVTPMMHDFWSVVDPSAAEIQQLLFMKNIAMLGGALFIAYFGTGPFSLDNHVLHYHLAGHQPPAPKPPEAPAAAHS